MMATHRGTHLSTARSRALQALSGACPPFPRGPRRFGQAGRILLLALVLGVAGLAGRALAAPAEPAPAPGGQAPQVMCTVTYTAGVLTSTDILEAPAAPSKGWAYLNVALFTFPNGQKLPVRVSVAGVRPRGHWVEPQEVKVERRPDGAAATLPVDPAQPPRVLQLQVVPWEPPALPEGLVARRTFEVLPYGRCRLSVAVRAPQPVNVRLEVPPDADLDPKPRDMEPEDCRDGKTFTATYRAASTNPRVPGAQLSWLTTEQAAAPQRPARRHEVRFGPAALALEADQEFVLRSVELSRWTRVFLMERMQPPLPPDRPSLLLASMEEDAANWGLARDRQMRKEGDSSGRWPAGRVSEVASTVLPEEWTAYPLLSFWVWAAGPLPGPLQAFVRADSPDTPDEDGYRATIAVAAAGWQQVRVPREQFAAVGRPAGWGRVSALRFRAPEGLAADAVLRLDEVRVNRE